MMIEKEGRDMKREMHPPTNNEQKGSTDCRKKKIQFEGEMRVKKRRHTNNWTTGEQLNNNNDTNVRKRKWNDVEEDRCCRQTKRRELSVKNVKTKLSEQIFIRKMMIKTKGKAKEEEEKVRNEKERTVLENYIHYSETRDHLFDPI